MMTCEHHETSIYLPFTYQKHLVDGEMQDCNPEKMVPVFIKMNQQMISFDKT